MTKKAPKPRKTKNKSSLPEPDDGDLWDHVAAGVRPLRPAQKNRAPDVEPPLKAAVQPGRRKSGARPYVAAVHTQPVRPHLPDLSHGSQPGLDKSTAKRLKKGQQKIEARMDLHGMTQAQAHRALDSFIDGSYGAGKRCVLVITGKGLKPDGAIGVLRAAVPRWLNEPPNRERVLAFHYATPKDGGEGALYVMLKRKR